MDLNTRSGPLKMVVQTLDLQLKRLSDFFLIIANVCLGLMLVGTAATIILRLFDVSFYWIWPWTMQFFVWMSFVGFYVVYRRGKDISVQKKKHLIMVGVNQKDKSFLKNIVL